MYILYHHNLYKPVYTNVYMKKTNKKSSKEKTSRVKLNSQEFSVNLGQLKKDVKERVTLNSKEFKVNLDRLQKDVKQAYESMRRMLPQAVKNVEVKPFGNASHIILPKEYAGKKASVFVKEK